MEEEYERLASMGPGGRASLFPSDVLLLEDVEWKPVVTPWFDEKLSPAWSPFFRRWAHLWEEAAFILELTGWDDDEDLGQARRRRHLRERWS